MRSSTSGPYGLTPRGKSKRRAAGPASCNDSEAVKKEESDMQTNGGSETAWGQETLRLLFVGLAVWIVGSVAAFALLSNAELPELSGTAMRAATLLVGFAMGALALLAYGALRFLNQSATVAALCAAA